MIGRKVIKRLGLVAKSFFMLYSGIKTLSISNNFPSFSTGFVLSIVKNIFDLHGAKYGVTNTENGVLFYFT
ncbi:hypothetical protein BK729_09085 [Bacillus thuringiensis serovar wratislaviensis]|nr:hypothetical protein BK729_09085 [Bacillus thuringiensis serovar wratislaviensis]